MKERKIRKTRVTREEVETIKIERAAKADKRKTVPGPWTELTTKCKSDTYLRTNKGMIGNHDGTYYAFGPDLPKGWYVLLFNITSKNIKKDVAKYGINEFMAASEKALNAKGDYGTIVLTDIIADHSQDEVESHRFISCYAKTNRKNIPGFAALRQEGYIIL